MESPVRIILGGIFVVFLLNASTTKVYGNVVPHNTNSTGEKDEPVEILPNSPDVALNELNSKIKPKASTSEENAKYKDRGRFKFNSQQRTSTETPRRVVRSTEASHLVVVTPMEEVTKLSEIVDSVQDFKKTNIPHITSTTTPIPNKIEENSEEEYDDVDNDEDQDSPFNPSKPTTTSFDNFFSIPGFEDFGHDSDFESSNRKSEHGFDTPTYGGFSSIFPHQASYGFSEPTHNSFKSEFFNHDIDLTTPRNDFFDKKFRQVSSSIIKNLDSIKTKSTPSTVINIQKTINENPVVEDAGNNSISNIPRNKSRVLFKNIKEIRLLDNDGAGSVNKELSDVQGTSIYYEMSVLSTETYAINNSDDYDCDNDTLPSGPTASTSVEEEVASISATETDLYKVTKPAPTESSLDILSTVHSSYFPVSSVLPTYNTITPFGLTTTGTVTTTERIKPYYNNVRSRNYSKRLNLNGRKESLNSVTSIPATNSSTISSRQTPKSQFSKYKSYTTPKSKRVWMWPRRGSPTIETHLPSESFYTTTSSTNRPRLSSPFFRRPGKPLLTTVSSDIDPVLQSDIAGLRKVFHSQSLLDNTVPSLSKRGSTKFGSSTSASIAIDANTAIPPTAWALASLRVPPTSQNIVFNKTESPLKSVDENELQSYNEFSDKVKTPTLLTATPKATTIFSTSTSSNSIFNNIIPKSASDDEQNRRPWQAIIPLTSSTATKVETQIKLGEISEESNLSSQNSVEESSTLEVLKESEKQTQSPWVPVIRPTKSTETNDTENDSTSQADTSKAKESITKLPSQVTTPSDESTPCPEVNETVSTDTPNTTPPPDFEITTIRFSYVPKEEIITSSGLETDTTETILPTTWHPAFPTRTQVTIIEDTPITTYRPQYTTEKEDEMTTTFLETTSPIEVSSQVLENNTKLISESTESPTKSTAETDHPTTLEVTTEQETITEDINSSTTKVETNTQPDTTKHKTTTTTQTTTVEPTVTTTQIVEDTTTIVVEVVTEINTEKERFITPTTSSAKNTETSKEPKDTDENSSSNEVTPDSTKTTKVGTSTETVTTIPMTIRTTTEMRKMEAPTQASEEITTQKSAEIHETTTVEITTDVQDTVKPGVEETTRYSNEMTTEASSRVFEGEEASSGAAIAIAVSTIGVIALVLLIGLLLVVRRRGRRGVYAQRCTPVSLDAYSLDSVSVGHRKGNQRLRASKRSYGNPAFDDEVTSHPMQYAALANFALDIESMTAEFAEIPSVTVKPDEVPPGCEDKNRYSNVLPLPETRVPLKRIGNDPTTEYINANFITGPGNIKNYYIASQAPLSNTVVDFWRMIWEQNSRLVVMLTEYMENGVEKCFEYLPPSEISDNKRTFGEFKVILKKREQRDKYAISSVQLINLATRSWREITHLWYFWPAKGVPDDYDSVIDFLCEMRSYMKVSQAAKEYDEEGVEVIYGDQNRTSFSNLSKLRSDEAGSGNGVNTYSPARAEGNLRRVTSNNGTLGRMKAASDIEGIRPCVVVCASGAGRSAALLALDLSARALPAAADVPRVVRHLRAQRPHSLSNRHHYIFVYKVLSEYGNKMLGGVDTI